MNFVVRIVVALALLVALASPSSAFTRGGYATSGGGGGCTTNGSDGFAGAPSGTPQFPTALAGYTKVPTWCVAGVHYHVGVASTVTLLDPVPSGSLASALTAIGGSLNSGNNVITFSTASQTISSYDFSLHGGFSVDIAAANMTVINNNFKVGANARPFLLLEGSITSGTTTIKNNTMDGNATVTNPKGGLVQGGGPGGTPCGTVIFEYNLIQNYWDQGTNFGVCAANVSTTIVHNFNVYFRGGYGSPSGDHGDISQIFSSNTGTPILTSLTMDYNLSLFNDPTQDWATQGFSVSGSAGNTLQFAAEDVSQNVFIVSNPFATVRNINSVVLIDSSWLNGTATLNNNFIDPTGLSTDGWLTIGTPGSGPFSGTVTGSGNFNMVTGATCAVTNGVCP